MLSAVSGNQNDYEKILIARKANGGSNFQILIPEMQHHDGITGTAKKVFFLFLTF
jgi:hypothetical protein